MGRVTRVIDASVDAVEEAKQTAYELIGDDNKQTNALDLFYTDNLEELENGIKRLNEFSDKCWLLSSILLYTLLYNNDLYQQSGLDWIHYSREARQRLGLDQKEITYQLSAARFWIQHHKALLRKGFSLTGTKQKLIRAELAYRLSGDINATIDHLVKDSKAAFIEWYSSFKSVKVLPSNVDTMRNDVHTEKGRYMIGDVEAVKISDDIAESDKLKLQEILSKVFDAIARGYEPAIIDVYDEKEAQALVRLRDKNRKNK